MVKHYLLDNSGVILTDELGNQLYFLAEDAASPTGVLGFAESEW